MSTYYRTEGSTEWKPLGNDMDLKEWGLKQLLDDQYKDSDSYWTTYIEFWRDGVRTYSFAEFNGWRGADDDGELSCYDYGDIDYIRRNFGDHSVQPYKYAPDRDWLLVYSFQYRI